MLLIVVTRFRLDRDEELRRDFGDWHDLKVFLDCREGERRSPQFGTPIVHTDRRHAERRHVQPDLRKLGWSVVEIDDLDHGARLRCVIRDLVIVVGA